MSEVPPKTPDDRIKALLALATEISERHESFPFPGLEPEAYRQIKATDEQFPGYCTPIHLLVERFSNEGIHVVMSPEHPGSGNVFVLPSQSIDVLNDSILPRDLHISEGMDDKLKQLILLSRTVVPTSE